MKKRRFFSIFMIAMSFIICGSQNVFANEITEEFEEEYYEVCGDEHYWDDYEYWENCEEDRIVKCLFCASTKIIPGVGHEWDDFYMTDEYASCEKEGKESIHCRWCNAIKEGSEKIIPVEKHYWLEYEDYYNCEEERKLECLYCSSIKVIPAGEHEWYDSGYIDNCEDERVVGCWFCDATKVVKGTEHEWSSYYTTDEYASCEEEGKESIHCTRCDIIKEGSERNIPKGEHYWLDNEYVDNCEEEREAECLYCNASEIIKSEHVWENSYTIEQEADCKNEGKKSIHCSICDSVKEGSIVNIPRLEHDLECIDFEWSKDYKECDVILECMNFCGYTKTDKAKVISEVLCDSTCSTEGLTLYEAIYGQEFDEIPVEDEINPNNHEMILTDIYKASTKSNGKIIETCWDCGKELSTKIIYYPKTISLSKTTFTYNGKIQKPTVIVKDSKGKVISSSNYSLSYSTGCTKPGSYNVKITFKGNYYGSVTKTFKIEKKTQPMTITQTSKNYVVATVKSKAQTFTITPKNVQGTVSYKSSNTKYITVNSKGKVTVKKGTPVGTYKVTVTAKGNSYYKSGSKTITVKVDKATQPMTITPVSKNYTVLTLKSKAQTFTITPKKAQGSVSYKSSNTKYITVNSKGKVTVKKGTPAGTYKITVNVKGNSNYKSGSKTVTIKVDKVNQPLTVTQANKIYTAMTLKSKAQTFTITPKKAQGSVSYKSSNTKYITVNSKGKVSIKKGTPKGTYKVTVTAKGNDSYKSGSKIVTITVK